MSDRPIAVGDLVQVVKPLAGHENCPVTSRNPKLFVVEAITLTNSHCTGCKKLLPVKLCAWYKGTVCGLERLKRIPPLSELEGQRTEENLKEPA